MPISRFRWQQLRFQGILLVVSQRETIDGTSELSRRYQRCETYDSPLYEPKIHEQAVFAIVGSITVYLNDGATTTEQETNKVTSFFFGG